MQNKLKKYSSGLLVLAMLLSGIAIPANAEEKIVFPGNSIADREELSAGETAGEVFLDSDSLFYSEEDLNDSGEVIVPKNADSLFAASDAELGSEVFPKGSSTDFYSTEDLNAGADNPIAGESSPILGDGSDVELGASGVSLNLSTSYVSLGSGQSATVKVSISGYPGYVYLQYAMTNSSIVTASWGSWSGSSIPITLKQKGIGSGYVYIYLKNAITNQTIYTAKITVNSYNSVTLSASSSNVSVGKGSTAKVTLSYSGYSGSVYMQYGNNNTNAYSCTWGSWSGSSVPLTISGKNAGSGTITVYLKNATTNATLATKTINVTVIGNPKLALSTSNVSLAKGSNSVVKATYSNYSGTVYMSYAVTNSSAFSCSWGNWSGSTVPLTITGKAAGTGTVYIYLKDYYTNTVLATNYFSVTVRDNAKVTVSTSSVSIYNDSSSKVKCTVSGMSGTYYLSYSTTNSSAYGCTWGSTWANGSIDLTISGKNAGKGTVYVYLKSASNNAVVASTYISVTVINRGTPTLKGSTTSLSLKMGTTIPVTYTYSNLYTSAYLQYGLTNSTAYSCSWGEWSGASIPLNVTGKSQGNGYVYVYLKRKSDDATLCTCTLYVSVIGSTTKVQQLSYKFSNFSGAGTLELCKYMFGDNAYAQTVYDEKVGDGGNCYGMASTEGLFYKTNNGVNVSSFGSGRSLISDLEMTDSNSSWGLTTKQFIQAMQIAQVSPYASVTHVTESALGSLVSAVTSEMANGNPVMIAIRGTYRNQRAGHAVIAYGVENVSNIHQRLLIIDSNNPLTTKYLDIYKNSSGNYTSWSYPLTNTDIWGTGKANADIGYVKYSTYNTLWEKRGKLAGSSLNLLITNSANFTIYDVENHLVAKVTNGKLETKNKDFTTVENMGVVLGQTPDDDYMLFMPVDFYIVENNDKSGNQFELKVANINLGVNVVTSADVVSICADDSVNMASVIIDSDEDETYSVEILSSREGDPKNIEWDGSTDGEFFSLSLDNGELAACGDETGLSVGDINGVKGDTVSYTIRAVVGEHGKINSIGKDVVLAGESRTYKITPDAGYKVKDVKVDGKSVGAVNSYVFDKVNQNHSISAEFEKVAKVFSDVSNSAYYYDAVQWAVANGVTGGATPTTFNPDGECTRAQIVMFLWRAKGSQEPVNKTNKFKDVSSSAYYYKAVLWAVENGITGGTSATTFSPDDKCTRAQVMTFLWRAKGSQEPVNKTNKFKDVNTGDYYYKPVLWAVEKGITSGMTSTEFGSSAVCTRAQAMTFLYKAIK